MCAEVRSGAGSHQKKVGQMNQLLQAAGLLSIGAAAFLCLLVYLVNQEPKETDEYL